MRKIKDFFKSKWTRLFIFAPCALYLMFFINKHMQIALYLAENYDIESELFLAGVGCWMEMDRICFGVFLLLVCLFNLVKLLIEDTKELITDCKEFIKNRKEKGDCFNETNEKN